MKKTFYVRTGQLREVMVAPTPVDAVRGAIMRGNEKELSLGLLTICNTEGFVQRPDIDLIFITENELKALRYNPIKFLAGFTMTDLQWEAYRKLKDGLEAFQDGLTDKDDL